MTDRQQKALDYLDERGISYERVTHAAARTIEDCRAVDEMLGVKVCKNLFLCNQQRTAFYLLLLRGDKAFKTKDISKQLGVSRLSFADESHMEELLGLSPGAVTVLGLLNDTENKVRLLIDGDLLTDEYIACHPCDNTATLKIKWRDILDLFLPTVHHEYTVVTVDPPINTL